MNYYEELGVQPDATAGQIHQAYKTLVRLFHPDSQTDEAVKAVAELQMRRLNGMLDTLLDPVKRSRYDESLSEAGQAWSLPPAELYRGGIERGWQRLAQAAVREWFWILTVMVIAGAAIWYVAYKDAVADVAAAPVAAPSAPTPPVPDPARPVMRPASPAVAEEAGTAAQGVSGRVAFDSGDSQSRTAAAEVSPPMSDRQGPEGAFSVTIAGPPAILPAAPVNTAAEPESTPANLNPPDGSEQQTSFGGDWLYAPQPDDTPRAGLYAPLYVEFLLVEEHGNLTGKYRARYRVADKALQSEVGFRVEGKTSGGKSVTLSWTSDEGAKGGVELVLRSSELLKVTWWTTAFGRHAGLTSGTATLVRQLTR